MTDSIKHNPPVPRYYVNGKGKMKELAIIEEGVVFSFTAAGTHYNTNSLTDTKAAAVALKVEGLQADLNLCQQELEDAQCNIDCIGIMIDKVKALETDK
jgi:hypothetical protein